MWILAPLAPSKKGTASSASEAAGTEPQNQPWYLTTGRCTLGRPSQKGGSTGKADIIVVGDASVSSIHAALDITPAAGAGKCPTITITDSSSKYGTIVQNQALAPNVATPLSEGHNLRLGYKSKFRLLWCPDPLVHVLHPTPTPPAADIAELVARTGGSVCPWGPQATHCLAAEGQPLSPALLCAALLGVPVVAASWLQELSSRPAWRSALPSTEGHAVHKATYTTSCQPQPGLQQQQQQQLELDLAAWAAAGAADLLQGLDVVVEPDQAALLEVCTLLGASTTTLGSNGDPSPHQLYVVTSASGSPCQAQQAGTAAKVPLDLLMACIAQRDVQPLRLLLEQHAASMAAAAAAEGSDTVATTGTAGSDMDGDEEEEVAAPLLPAPTSQRRHMPAARAAAAAAASVAAAPATKGSRAAAAAAAAAAARSPAAGAAGKSKKRAAPDAAPDAAEVGTPSGKRRKGRTSPPKAATEHPAPAAATTAGNPVPAATRPGGRGAGSSAPVAAAAPAEPASNGVVLADLVVAQPAQQAQQQQQQQSTPRQAGSHHRKQQQPVVNFKAFTRKGQAAGAPAPAAAAVVQLELFTEQEKDPDTEIFLREEEQRRKRMQKADELFNAAVGPAKSSRAASTRTGR